MPGENSGVLPWWKTTEGRARRRENQRLYRLRHPDRVRAQMVAWKANNPDYECERSRRRYATSDGRARQLAANRSWQSRNRGKVNEALRRYSLTEKGRAKILRRRAALRGGEGRLTAAEWREVVALYEGRCAYCFAVTKKPEQDRVVPLSRGGSHVASNVVPACRGCNGSKGALKLSDWLFPGKGGRGGGG